LLFVGVLVLIAIAFIDQIRIPLIVAFYEYGGGAAQAIGATWAGISVSPLYQQFHVLIWFVGGIVFTASILLLRKKNKIPGFHISPAQPQQVAMQGPQTVVIREVPVPTSTPQPVQTINAPNAPLKETEKTA
jgi:hypothetical protein